MAKNSTNYSIHEDRETTRHETIYFLSKQTVILYILHNITEKANVEKLKTLEFKKQVGSCPNIARGRKARGR